MNKVPPLSGKEICIHSNTSLKKGTLHAILMKARISREKLTFLLTVLGGFLT